MRESSGSYKKLASGGKFQDTPFLGGCQTLGTKWVNNLSHGCMQGFPKLSKTTESGFPAFGSEKDRDGGESATTPYFVHWGAPQFEANCCHFHVKQNMCGRVPW